MPPYPPWGIYTLLVYTHPTTPWVYHPTQYRLVYSYRSAAAEEREPWAQDGRNPWVRASQTLTVVNPVEKSVPVCAESPALSRKNWMNDRIDIG